VQEEDLEAETLETEWAGEAKQRSGIGVGVFWGKMTYFFFFYSFVNEGGKERDNGIQLTANESSRASEAFFGWFMVVV
jgi:hypothetical protein